MRSSRASDREAACPCEEAEHAGTDSLPTVIFGYGVNLFHVWHHAPCFHDSMQMNFFDIS